MAKLLNHVENNSSSQRQQRKEASVDIRSNLSYIVRYRCQSSHDMYLLTILTLEAVESRPIVVVKLWLKSTLSF